jgi:hypothetical protein
LKNTIRQCVTFKQEIGGIHPSILDESDSEEEEAAPQEIDYQTLLAFAARIGKHNTLAAREAEAEALRIKLAARNKVTNGESTTQSVTGPENDDAAAAIERVSAQIALQRAHLGLSFPDAMILRNGALGGLTLFAEQQRSKFRTKGSDEERERLVNTAVDEEVEKMVRATEEVAEPQDSNAEDERMEDDPESPVLGRRDTFDAEGQASSSRAQAQRPPQQPAKGSGKLNLDFNLDDSDEDE